MHRAIAVLVMLSLLASVPHVAAQDLWAGKDGNIRNVDTRGLVTGKSGFYLATQNEVYAAKDAKSKWESVFSLPAGDNQISCIGRSSDAVLVGTRRGLFKSEDGGANWKNVFRTIIPEKNNILSIVVSPFGDGRVVIGTEKGVFASTDKGNSWKDISFSLKNRPVKYLALARGAIYAGGDDGVYLNKAGLDGWERVCVRSSLEDTGEEETSDFSDFEDGGEDRGVPIAVAGSRLYVGAGRGISYTDDEKSWSALPGDGLSGIVTHIAASTIQSMDSRTADAANTVNSNSLYCSTTKGVFRYEKEKSAWLELYKGPGAAFTVNGLVLDSDKENSLWALTDRGLYKLESSFSSGAGYIDVERNLKDLKIIFDNEPPFIELQKAAIKFADVSPDKIRNWQNQSRIKTLLPKVSFGCDQGTSTNYEIYTSATKDYVVAGPNDLSNGMDISVSWDLAGLIWSDDQTNIDVRSRLTTQLRNDVLDDLRRAYYERKRMQFELMTSTPKDMKARFDKEMRIQELGQAIDDLTGNYFSEHIKR